MTSSQTVRIAVDIGGTFTDVAAADPSGKIVATTKTPTTPGNPTAGALTGANKVLETLGMGFGQVTGFIHGTTLATNALIERRGARVATVATEGFRDILEIAYERRYSQYDINIEKPDLIVPRSRSFTIAERISASGEVLKPLDETQLDRLCDQIEAVEAEAVAVCFLHAYANAVHEQRLHDLLASRLPQLFVSLSSDVSPEAREFERLCTTVANAYIQPLMATYLAQFAEAFAAEGLRCPVMMMTSGGGMTTIETARRLPIRLVESGPSGGAILAARVAAETGSGQVLSFDMGGTTAKLCLIDDYAPQTARSFEISRAERFIKGSGMPARIPVVEMIEIGAGGGSIAGVDRLGRLQVGPRSAGSEPGPAAFGRGGAEATVTDADVELGYIDPEAFAEGRLKIDTAAARQVLDASVGMPMALDSAQAALGVSQIVDESMASAGRMHAVESGKDLSERVMIAFGGNGPLHATRVAKRAAVRKILIPPDPGVGSAVGFLFAPVSFELVRSRYSTLSQFDVEGVNTLFDAMLSEAVSVVRGGAPEADLVIHRSAFMRYRGQGHEIEIDMPNRPLSEADIGYLTASFEAAYSAQLSRAVPGMVIEVLNWAIHVSTAASDISVSTTVPEARAAEPSGEREITCDETGERLNAKVFTRQELLPGAAFRGPALVVEPQTTTLVSAEFEARVDGAMNLVLTRSDARGRPQHV